jgi:hypothetical protein
MGTHMRRGCGSVLTAARSHQRTPAMLRLEARRGGWLHCQDGKLSARYSLSKKCRPKHGAPALRLGDLGKVIDTQAAW